MWASYARVSDPRPQKDNKTIGLDRYGLERQDRANEKYIRAREYTGDIAIFRDRISGTTETREHFEALLMAVRSKKVLHVCIPEVDRLARDEFVAATLIFELWAAGATVHDANRNRIIDRNNSQSRREFFQDAIEASSERERITRRMYAGKLEKIRDGKPERPLNAFGWRSGQIDETEAEVVRWMYARAIQVGVLRVAEELNTRAIVSRRGIPFQHSSVRVILTNPIYRGHYEFGRKGERLTLEIPAIITPELWYRVQASIKDRHNGQSTVRSRSDDYPLMGRIRCSDCGGTMTPFVAAVRQNAYYFCRNTLATRKAKCTHRKYHRADQLHAEVLNALQELNLNQGLLEQAILTTSPETDNTAERKRLTKRLERAKAAYEAEVDTLEEYSQTKKDLLEKISLLEQIPTIPKRDLSVARAELTQALSASSLAEVMASCNVLVTIGQDGTILLKLQ
jgi:site-specific DNA recombinase